MEKFPDFNKVEYVAGVLGINPKTVYDAISRGEIPVVRIGRAFRVPGKWLKEKAETQPKPEAA